MTDFHIHPVRVWVSAARVLDLHPTALEMAKDIADKEDEPLFYSAACRSKIHIAPLSGVGAADGGRVFRQKFHLLFARTVVSDDHIFSRGFLRKEQLKRNVGVHPGEIPYLTDDDRLRGLAKVVAMERVTEFWTAPELGVSWEYREIWPRVAPEDDDEPWFGLAVMGKISEESLSQDDF
jgi:hypothetical protein